MFFRSRFRIANCVIAVLLASWTGSFAADWQATLTNEPPGNFPPLRPLRASYRFEPPHGYTHAEVLLEAHRIRVERDDYNIAREHLADAIEALVMRSRQSLSEDRSAKDPYE